MGLKRGGARSDDNPLVVDAIAELKRGRESCVNHAWRDAYDSLSAAGRASPLAAEDLERLATSAYMLGCGEEYVALLERAHGAYVDAKDAAGAVRCAIWIGAHFAQREEILSLIHI